MGFVHLHVHSEYSLLESTCRIEQLVQTAKARGFEALAITDRDVLYGAIPFYKACIASGIKPIIGMEVSIKDSEEQPKAIRMREKKERTLVFIAQNNRGYQELIKMSTEIQTSRDKQISRKALSKYKEGLFILSSGPKGDIEQTWQETRDQKKTWELAHFYKKMYGNRFFIEVQDHGQAEEKNLKLEMSKLAQSLHIPMIATNNVYYLSKEEAKFQDCLSCIKSGDLMTSNERPRLETEEYYLKTESEMRKIFQSMPESIELAERLASACQINLTFNEPMLPKYPISEGFTTKEFIDRLCQKGLHERYETVSQEHIERLNYELKIINGMGFNDYFLIVWDLMTYAREHGIFPGPGRGSAAGSLVAYVLKITDVDPLKHGLLFERFLNPERVSMPDIDIDFPDIHRDRMIQYVSSKYGKQHVAQIITFGTLAAKAAIRDVGKVLDVKSSLIDRVAKLIPSRPGITLDLALKESKELKRTVETTPELHKVFQYAQAIEGVPRHTSTHAAGVIISEKSLLETVPLQEGHDDISLTQYPMEVLEELGLLKMDFLGLRNLTLIETILYFIRQKENKVFDLKDISLDDPKTFELLSNGDTTGVFQLESEGIREVLRQLKPTHFEDIVAVNALYRPGPMSFISHFIESKHGNREVTYPHPDLKPVLEETYGVIVYQEQIMQIASIMAGFSLGEADLLRRAVSKKKREVLEEQEQFFVEGSIKKGYDKKTATQVYQLIVRFADYGFNRSHAVAYSFIAYQLAYLKANYPMAFMAALMSSVLNHSDKLMAYIQECRGKEINILPPSINHSLSGFSIEDNGIRFGLNAIKNVGIQAVQEICAERQKGQYLNLFDLCKRVSLRKVNRRALESLIFAGALDDFRVDRAQLLATLDGAMKIGETEQNNDQFSLLDEGDLTYHYAEVPPLQLNEKLYFEKEAIGFYLSAHPIDAYKDKLRTLEYTPLVSLSNTHYNKKVRVVIYIEKVKQIKTKKGSLMAFLTVSDASGVIEAVVFPKVFEGNVSLFQSGQCLYLEATLDTDQATKLIVQKAMLLEDVKVQATLYLKVEEKHQTDGILFRIKSLMEEYPGTIPVILYYEEQEKVVKLTNGVANSSELLKAMKNYLGEENVRLKQ